MDNQHPVTPQTCVLKMHTKCEKAQRKIKRGLEKLDGVHSIKIDSNEGRVTVTSTSDPELFIEMLTKAAKQCNLIWEPESSPPLNNHPSGGGNSSRQPPHHHHNHHHHHHHHHHSNYYKFNQNPEIAQELQELAKNRTVKTLEVTHSKNIKMTFMDNDEINSNQAHVAKTDMDSEKETMSQSLHSKSPTTTPTTQPPPPIPTTMQPQAPPPTMTSQFGNETAKDSGIGSSKLMGYSQDFPLKSPPPTPQPQPATIMQPPAPQTTRAIHVGNGSRRDSGIGSSSSVEEPIKPFSVTPKMVSPASTDITCGDESCIIM